MPSENGWARRPGGSQSFFDNTSSVLGPSKILPLLTRDDRASLYGPLLRLRFSVSEVYCAV